MLTALGIDAAINVALLPSMGVVAAVIGAVASNCLYVPADLWICRRELNVPLRPLVTTVLRGLLAAAAMTLVLLAGGTHTLSVGQWLFGGAIALLAYATALLLSGEVSLGEVRHAGRAVPGLATRRASLSAL